MNNFFPPRVGGSSHLSDALARGYARSGHEVLVLTAAYGDAPAEEERDGLRIVRLPAYTLPESRHQRQLRPVVRDPARAARAGWPRCSTTSSPT